MNKGPIPQGNYRPAIRYQQFVYTAGMTPRKDGNLILSGKISPDIPVEFSRAAVEQAADNALTAIENTLQSGERIAQIMSMTVYLNSLPTYTAHSRIGDLATSYLAEKLGDCAIGARAVVGCISLPGDAPVEIQLVAAVE